MIGPGSDKKIVSVEKKKINCIVTFSTSVGASVETAETEVWTVAIRLAGGPTGGHLATQKNEQINKHLSKQNNKLQLHNHCQVGLAVDTCIVDIIYHLMVAIMLVIKFSSHLVILLWNKNSLMRQYRALAVFLVQLVKGRAGVAT